MSDTISRLSSELNVEHDAVMFSLECGSVREFFRGSQTLNQFLEAKDGSVCLSPLVKNEDPSDFS